MPRFYSITVGNKTWSSQDGGADDPGALNVEFDFFEVLYGVPRSDAGGATLTIHGVAFEDLQQAPNFFGQQLSMKAGMSPGLPLTSPPAYNPTQSGPILNGQVLQSFGNWVGTEMTIDFVVYPSVFTQANPGNFTFNWQKGMSLQDALTQTLADAYAQVSPTPAPVFQLAGQYAPQPNGHLTRYSTLRNLGAAVNSMTKAASPDGLGVRIGFLNPANVIFVYDGPGEKAPIQIQFTDLVGQPTWVDQLVMQFTTVLRADISVGDVIKMPPGLPYAPGAVTTAGSAFGSSASSPLQLKYKSAFQGPFQIKGVRQLGKLQRRRRHNAGYQFSSAFR